MLTGCIIYGPAFSKEKGTFDLAITLLYWANSQYVIYNIPPGNIPILHHISFILNMASIYKNTKYNVL